MQDKFPTHLSDFHLGTQGTEHKFLASLLSLESLPFPIHLPPSVSGGNSCCFPRKDSYFTIELSSSSAQVHSALQGHISQYLLYLFGNQWAQTPENESKHIAIYRHGDKVGGKRQPKK